MAATAKTENGKKLYAMENEWFYRDANGEWWCKNPNGDDLRATLETAVFLECVSIEHCMQALKTNHSCRGLSIAFTKLTELSLWLQVALEKTASYHVRE